MRVNPEVKSTSMLLPILLLASTYCLTGLMGLTWAVETGFATPVWPPSGIALAAVLMCGYRVTPGVFLGSILANLLSDNASGADVAVTLPMLGTASGIAFGASLQAMSGAFLINRIVGFPDPLNSPIKIITFLLCCGPINCLVNAVIGPTVLLASGAFGSGEWLETSITWWSGDTLGSLIFTPMIVVWGIESRAGSSVRCAAVSLALIAAFVLSIFSYDHVRSLDRSRLLLDLEHRASDIPVALERVLDGHLSVLGSLDGLFRVVETVDSDQYRVFCESSLSVFEGIHALSWNRRFLHGDRDEVEADLHTDFGLTAGLTERDGQKRLIPASVRQEYVAVTMIEPLESNRKAIGYDVLSHPVRREALMRACDTGEAVSTGRIQLVQEPGPQFGFLVFRPSFADGAAIDTVEERRRAIAGYHTAVYRIEEMLGSLVTDSSLRPFMVRLIDLTAPAQEQELCQLSFDSTSRLQNQATPITDASIAVRWSYEVPVPGRRWELQIGVSESYVDRQLHRSGWGVLIAGLIISSLIGALSLLTTGRHKELEEAVRERTKRLRAEITAREAAESNLLQSQNLQIVGQLTGGIAHDFNNLLAVISGNAELLNPQTENDHESVDSIVHAASRGAELTQRLLAFSRRQVLRPSSIDPAGMIVSVKSLLARSLGATIDIVTSAPADTWCVKADSGQLENSLLNLSVNARDAMPNGGRLQIDCRNVVLGAADCKLNPDAKPGEFVAIAVTDSGEGMSPDTCLHAFEPFFTTKSVGQGSGLGLSMVYGFAKQSGGHASLHSELGRGTTVTLFLPQSSDPAEKTTTENVPKVLLGKGQKILLIEDNDAVRAQTNRSLVRLGYRVVEAADASEARAVLARINVELILSDIVLPGGTSGLDFAAEVRRKDPKVLVVFMSGFTADTGLHDALWGAEQVLLDKPVRLQTLATALSLALNANPSGAVAP